MKRRNRTITIIFILSLWIVVVTTAYILLYRFITNVTQLIGWGLIVFGLTLGVVRPLTRWNKHND